MRGTSPVEKCIENLICMCHHIVAPDRLGDILKRTHPTSQNAQDRGGKSNIVPFLIANGKTNWLSPPFGPLGRTYQNSQ